MPTFHQATLPNGLRIAAEIDNRGYSAAYGYFVRSGSRDEVDHESGLSHFLEHMMFKGTQHRSAADVNRELDELGGQGNAYTSEEQTVYYATVLPKFQDRIVDLLTDMMRPTLDEDEFNTERQVILEEIAKYEDQPPFGAFERAMEVYFGPRGLGRRVLGTSHSIEAMTATAMKAYFARRYRPENMVLAASGNVDFDALVAQVEKQTAHWADLPLPPAPDRDAADVLPAGIALDPSLETPDAHQAYLIRMSPGPSSASQDRYATRILASIVGDEGGSRLFWDLIDTGKAEVATVWPQEFMDTGAWFAYLACNPEDVDSNRKLMQDVFTRTASDGVTQEELTQAINKATAGLIMQSERPSNRLFGLGSRWLTRNEYYSIDDQLDRLRSITVESVNESAKRYLTETAIEVIASAALQT
ncbi:Insulinase (Peptidase family M16) [Rubripirellula amarantea]|uniref:Insulinase (Peptidase family M16) n=1 Tax=Rubripirellula amarantea TaxID=2527999 RepID=A0A5C5WJP0_9BACT|nr:pitrilysin family protein [Rubripirellula amarantea]TWT50335.1 Insulinase (Peptidase family M16) [Rubripirellula amarantea]